VELCLFDAADRTVESMRVPLVERTNMVWHGYLPDARSSSAATGSTGPGARAGQRCAMKLLLDPYARAIGRPLAWHPSLFAFAAGSDAAGEADTSNSAPPPRSAP
jgi:glycogen operon protein